MGITGTPVVDLASRALFLDAMITPDGGTTKKHLILSLDVDTGVTNSGWPVDVEATATYQNLHFTAEIQQQRPALAIVGNILYVGYGSMQDCDLYHGWLAGVPINNPASVTAWAAATSPDSHGGAIWGVGGIASDGNNPFVTTGNIFDPGGDWSGGEAVIRFQPGPILAEIPAITGRLPTGSSSTMAAQIWVAPAHCWWTCRAQRHPAWWLRWVRMAMRIWLIAVTSAGSIRQCRRLRFQLSGLSKPQPRIGLTKARMLLFAVATTPSLLFALLQPVRLPSTSQYGACPGTHAALLSLPPRTALMT